MCKVGLVLVVGVVVVGLAGGRAKEVPPATGFWFNRSCAHYGKVDEGLVD